MNWDGLQVYRAVWAEGSLAAAARRLRVDATTVGRRLDRFEQELGVKLFQRTPDGFVPTAEGDEISESVERMERQAAIVERAIRGGTARLAGPVKLTCTRAFAHDVLLPELPAFRARWPDIRIELHVDGRMVDLARGEADLAVRFSAVDGGVPGGEIGDVLATRIGTIGIAPYAAPSYLDARGRPEGVDSIVGHDIVLVTMDFMRATRWFERVQPNNRIVLVVDDLGAAAQAAASGLGIVAVPCFGAPLNRLERVGTELIGQRACWLLMPGDLRRTARVRAVHEFLTDLLARRASLLSGLLG